MLGEMTVWSGDWCQCDPTVPSIGRTISPLSRTDLITSRNTAQHCTASQPLIWSGNFAWHGLCSNLEEQLLEVKQNTR